MPSLATQTPELCQLTASQIAPLVRAGKVSAREVTEAHVQRIEQVNPHLNAVVVPLFEQARRDADAVDAARMRGATLGPLAGVPTTIKECFHVAGTASSMGIERFRQERISLDGPLVASLRAAGAIVLGKTNVPQLMLMHESDNPVYGRTLHPDNEHRSPGGSSGGEAAIIAAHGSALGLGSDLGGSIRQPAHACGIVGLKPTSGRLTNAGCRTNLNGMEAIHVQPGPLARSVADVNLAMRVLSAASVQSDPQVPPLAWPDPHGVSLVGLRVAMWTDDGWFHCAPALRRAVHLAADALRDRGAVVEEFQPPAVAEAMQLYFSLLSADGGADARHLLGDSPRHAQIARLVRLGRLPNLLRPMIGGMLNLLQQRYLSQLVRAARHGSAAEYWQWTAARTRYVERFMQTFHEQRYDAFLCPPHALPALTHGSFIHLPAAASYCMLPNLLGVPAGVVPVTRVGAYEQSDRRASHDRVERAALAVEAGSSGLPVGVQVGAPHWREDTVLAVMGAIEAQFPRSGC